jgi:hypothetical protein
MGDSDVGMFFTKHFIEMLAYLSYNGCTKLSLPFMNTTSGSSQILRNESGDALTLLCDNEDIREIADIYCYQLAKRYGLERKVKEKKGRPLV